MTKKLVIWIVLITFTAGCTTAQQISADAATIQTHVNPGDKVKIYMNDETLSTLKMHVTGITDEGLQGKGYFVQYSDMNHIEIKNISTAKTLLLVGGLLLVVVTVVAASEAALVGALGAP